MYGRSFLAANKVIEEQSLMAFLFFEVVGLVLAFKIGFCVWVKDTKRVDLL